MEVADHRIISDYLCLTVDNMLECSRRSGYYSNGMEWVQAFISHFGWKILDVKVYFPCQNVMKNYCLRMTSEGRRPCLWTW